MLGFCFHGQHKTPPGPESGMRKVFSRVLHYKELDRHILIFFLPTSLSYLSSIVINLILLSDVGRSPLYYT